MIKKEDYNEEPLHFEVGEILETPQGRAKFIGISHHTAVQGKWVPQIRCVPLNKNGEPNKGILKARSSQFVFDQNDCRYPVPAK